MFGEIIVAAKNRRDHFGVFAERLLEKMDDARRIRPVKPGKASKHIDGAVAHLIAQKGLMLMPMRRRSAGVMVV
jgi:hypothetical protein